MLVYDAFPNSGPAEFTVDEDGKNLQPKRGTGISDPDPRVRQELFRSFESLAKEQGCCGFLVAEMPLATLSKCLPPIRLSNLPLALQRSFWEGGPFSSVESLQLLSRSDSPFAVDGSAHTRPLRDLKEHVDEVSAPNDNLMNWGDITKSFVIPLICRSAQRLFVLFPSCGWHPDFSLSEICRRTGEIMTSEGVDIVFSRKAANRQLLTARETECLQWVAAGKTSGEIAWISGLSKHTVNHYLADACRKLNSVNRIQAVVNAVRQGLI